MNLYRYVANNPLIFVDRFGLEKVLILIGESLQSADDFGYGVNYQIQKYMNQGVKRENILLKRNIVSPTTFNQAVQPYKGNINEIVYLSHGAPDSLGRGAINKENVSQIQSLADTKNPIQKLLLIACNAGAGFDPIAQDIANSIKASVEAANGYVSVDTVKKYTLQDLLFESGEPTFFNKGNLFTNWSKNNFLLFNPR